MLLSDPTLTPPSRPHPIASDPHPTPPSSRHWQGKLQLHYSHSTAGTRLDQSYTEAPLRIQRPFYPEGPEVCQSVIVHTAGGMVGGDRLQIELQLGPKARAFVTTAAASKIYRSNGHTVEQTLHAHVAPRACLEWFPQEAIVFNQARYHQHQRIDLAPGGQWMGWDINRLGRTAHGEQFVEGEWRSHIEVWQAGQPLWIDRQWLPASPEIWASPHGLHHCPIVACFAWVGVDVEPELVQQVRQCWQGRLEHQQRLPAQSLPEQEKLGRSPTSLPSIGVSRLQKGLICRYRGHDRAEAQRWFTAVWQLIRQHQWGQSPARPRVWQR